MMWKVKRLLSGLGALQKALEWFELRRKRTHAFCVCAGVPDEGRPIKKPPEERAFSRESVGGGREDGRAIVCHGSILRGGIRTFLLCSAGRLHTNTTQCLIRADQQHNQQQR